MNPVLARRRAIAAFAAAPIVAVAVPAAASAAASPASGKPRIPAGFADVDPRTAKRVPLWQPLTPEDPIFPGDPEFTYEIFNTIAEDGYLLEHITSLGTHTGTHISAPAHFVEGAKYLDEIGEAHVLMPLTVIDVRKRVQAEGGDFSLKRADVLAFEQRYGKIPPAGCVLLLTGFGRRFFDQAYFDPAPGFTGGVTGWLYEERGIIGIGSDTFGPDATSDEDFSSTLTALEHGGITVENVGPGLAKMRSYGDWININGGRPHFSGFQQGITGFTLQP